MKIAIFGATGGTGQRLIYQALEKRYSIVAIVRSPQSIRLEHRNLHIHQGDVLDRKSFEAALEGQDAVLSAVGLGNMLHNRTPGAIFSVGTNNILAAMKDCGIKRFIGVSASGVQESDHDPLLLKYIIRPWLRDVLTDMRAMETIIQASELDWTIVRPTLLNNGPYTGIYRLLRDHILPHGRQVARADLADFMLKQLLGDEYIGSTVSIAY